MTSSVSHGMANRFVANKKYTTARAVYFLLVAEMGFDWMMKKAKCEYNDGLFAARDCAFE